MTSHIQLPATNEEYRKVLLQRKATLQEALATNYYHMKLAAEESDIYAEHLLAEEALMVKLNHILYSRFREVTKALERLDHGMFGDCVTCHTAIAPERLQKSPWAQECLTCSEGAVSSREPELIGKRKEMR